MRIGASLGLALALATGAWMAWRNRAPLPEPTLLPVTTMSGSESYASFSPDATQVAFTWEGEGRPQGVVPSRDIWIKLVSGMETRRLTSSPEDDWAPDGRYVVHTREEGWRGSGVTNLWMIGVEGGSDRRLTNGSRDRLGPPVWSRDGFIYYRQPRPGGTDYFRIPAAGGAPERITHGGALMAEVSWEAKALLYSRREGTGPLYLMNLEDRSERKLEECALSRNLAASPGAFYYIGCADGPEQPLYRLDTASGRRQQLGMVSNATLGLTVSPDGKTILYARENRAGADLMMVESFR